VTFRNLFETQDVDLQISDAQPKSALSMVPLLFIPGRHYEISPRYSGIGPRRRWNSMRIQDGQCFSACCRARSFFIFQIRFARVSLRRPTRISRRVSGPPLLNSARRRGTYGLWPMVLIFGNFWETAAPRSLSAGPSVQFAWYLGDFRRASGFD